MLVARSDRRDGYCIKCNKKLKKIKEDSFYPLWKREFHKKCFKEHYLELDTVKLFSQKMSD